MGGYEVDAYWAERQRVPPGPYPEVDVLPFLRDGRIWLVHHVQSRVAAAFDPATGTVEPLYALAGGARWFDGRVSGRYLPLRSGVLAYYRTSPDAIVVQHRRKRLEIPDDCPRRLLSLLPLRVMRFRR